MLSFELSCMYDYIICQKLLHVQLRERLQEKWSGESLNSPGGVKFWIHFPDSHKIDCCIASSASTKV